MTTLLFFGFFAIAAGFLSVAAGFGGVMLILPVKSAMLGVTAVLPVAALAQFINNSYIFSKNYKSAELPKISKFLLIALPFSIIGALCVPLLSDKILAALLGIYLIFCGILKIFGFFPKPESKFSQLVFSSLAGFLSGFLGVPGGFDRAVFSSKELSIPHLAAAESASGVVINACKFIVYYKLNMVNSNNSTSGLCIGCGIVIGSLIASKYQIKFKKAIYGTITAAFMIAASIVLIYSHIF